LIDPQGNKPVWLVEWNLVVQNNTVEYEALIQGLKKAMDFGIKEIIVLWRF